MKMKLHDKVEVLPNPIFRDLTGFVGTVVQLLPAGLCIVDFSCKLGSKTRLDPEVIAASVWNMQEKYLRVLDSPRDDLVGDLEEKIADLEDDLAVARSCLEVSEEMREKQFELIDNLIVEIDRLKAELYLKGEYK